MSLSRMLSDLFIGSGPDADAPSSGDDVPDQPATVIYECRHCGTNVSPETDRCPACDGDDIVRYSID